MRERAWFNLEVAFFFRGITNHAPFFKYWGESRAENAIALACPISYNRLSYLMITYRDERVRPVCHSISRHQTWLHALASVSIPFVAGCAVVNRKVPPLAVRATALK